MLCIVLDIHSSYCSESWQCYKVTGWHAAGEDSGGASLNRNHISREELLGEAL
jgi:hypothetical protein